MRDGEILRDYILRVTAERDELQGANEYHRLALESAQKQIAELVAERDAPAKRIADAPRALVCAHGWNALTSYNSHDLEPLNGQRVALVKVE